MERRKSLRRSSRRSLGVSEISKTFDYRDLSDNDADDEAGPSTLVKRVIGNLPIERFTLDDLALSSQNTLDTFEASFNENVPINELVKRVAKHLPVAKAIDEDSNLSDASTIPIAPARCLRGNGKTLKPSEEDFLRNFEERKLRTITRSLEKRKLSSSGGKKFTPTKTPRLSTGDKYKQSKPVKTTPNSAPKIKVSGTFVKSPVITTSPRKAVKLKAGHDLNLSPQKSTKSLISKTTVKSPATRRSPRKTLTSTNKDSKEYDFSIKSPQKSNKPTVSKSLKSPVVRISPRKATKTSDKKSQDSDDSIKLPQKSNKPTVLKSPVRISPRKAYKTSQDSDSSIKSRQKSIVSKSLLKSPAIISSPRKASKSKEEASRESDLLLVKSVSARHSFQNDDSDSSEVDLSLIISPPKSSKLVTLKSPATNRSQRKANKSKNKHGKDSDSSENNLTLTKSTIKFPQKAVEVDVITASKKKSPILPKTPKTTITQVENSGSNSDLNLTPKKHFKAITSHSLNIEQTPKRKKPSKKLSKSFSSQSSKKKKIIGLPNTLLKYFKVKKTVEGLNRNFRVEEMSPKSQESTEQRSWYVVHDINQTNVLNERATIVIEDHNDLNSSSNRLGQQSFASSPEKDYSYGINHIKIHSPNEAATPKKSITAVPSEQLSKSPGKSSDLPQQTPRKNQAGSLSNIISSIILSPFEIPSPNFEHKEISLAIRDYLEHTKTPSSSPIKIADKLLSEAQNSVKSAIDKNDVHDATDNEDGEEWVDLEQPGPSGIKSTKSMSSSFSSDEATTARRVTVVKKKRTYETRNKKNTDELDYRKLHKWAIKVFKHKTGTRHSKEILNEVGKSAEKYIDQVMDDVAAYANHAGRDTIIKDDFLLYFKRIGVLNQATGFSDLVLEYLPSEYRKLVPCAGAYNKILK